MSNLEATCSTCGEKRKPQLYHEPHTCRSCRALASISNEIDAARERQEPPAYIKALLIYQALVRSPELGEALGY